MRKYYWYFTSFFKKHGFLIVSSIIVGVIFFSFFIPVLFRRFEAKKKTYIGMVGEYTLDSLPASIQQLVSIGLTRIEKDGSVTPAASARWNIEDNGKTYRFIVNDQLYWQDGKQLSPDDVHYDFADVQVLTTANDIVYKLPDTYVPFPSIVSQPLFRSIQHQGWFFSKENKIIGLGPYSILSFKEQKQQLQRRPRLIELVIDSPEERRTYRFYQNEEEAISAFKRGEVDVVTDLSLPHDIGSWKTTQTVEKLHPERYLAIFFNLNSPLFSKNIRQALAYSIQKSQDEKRAYGPINPLSWAYLEAGKSYEYDLARASERLLSEPPGEKLEFELLTTTTYEAQAENIKKDWENLGQKAAQDCLADSKIENKANCENLKIKVNIKISNFPDTSNFQTILIGQESPPDPDQYYLWHSDQSTNFFGYKNTRIDALLEKGRQVNEKQERKAIYQEFQQFLLEDCPVIFLEHLKSYEVSRKQ
jgi:peptide/nickel transport system substrate-binding protein